jgi:hypothetical protein
VLMTGDGGRWWFSCTVFAARHLPQDAVGLRCRLLDGLCRFGDGAVLPEVPSGRSA